MASEATCFVEALAGAAVAPVLRAWRAEHPGMGVLALVPEAESPGVERLQAVCREEAVPLVGGVFPALVRGGLFSTAGAWLLRLDEVPRARSSLPTSRARETSARPPTRSRAGSGPTWAARAS